MTLLVWIMLRVYFRALSAIVDGKEAWDVEQLRIFFLFLFFYFYGPDENGPTYTIQSNGIANWWTTKTTTELRTSVRGEKHRNCKQANWWTIRGVYGRLRQVNEDKLVFRHSCFEVSVLICVYYWLAFLEKTGKKLSDINYDMKSHRSTLRYLKKKKKKIACKPLPWNQTD